MTPPNTRIAIFYPTPEGKVGPYYDNIYELLGGAMGSKYNISVETLGELDAHNTAIPDVIQTAYDDDQTAQGSTSTKDEELADSKHDMLRELQRIPKLDNWDEDDGQTLGIRVFSEKPDLNTVKPVITGITLLPAFVEIDWRKNGMDGVYVHGSYDGSSFTQIGTDNRSPWEDRRTNQVPGEAEVRHYKMQYMVADKPVGLFSDVVKVVVQM